MKMYQVEFNSGHTKIVFANSKLQAYGKALGSGEGRIIAVYEVVTH